LEEETLGKKVDEVEEQFEVQLQIFGVNSSPVRQQMSTMFLEMCGRAPALGSPPSPSLLKKPEEPGLGKVNEPSAIWWTFISTRYDMHVEEKWFPHKPFVVLAWVWVRSTNGPQYE
jgi:hypothetical protein